MPRRKKRIGLRAAICAAALVGLLAAASPALASTAFLEPYITKYEAYPGETNEVAITDSNVVLGTTGKTTNDTIEISDAGATIRAEWGRFHWGGCEAIAEKDRVWCAVEDGMFEVTLGDLDDRFDMGPLSLASVRAWVWGDEGDDMLLGGRASDLLFGGDGTDTLRGRAGADWLSGGGGQDFADYSERTVPVTVSLPESSPPYSGPISVAVEGGIVPEPVVWPGVAGNDGASGEGDDVQASVEDVSGGSAGDTLVGSSVQNWLNGHAGNDSLYGGQGNDDLHGEGGNDFLRGSGDGDRLYGGPGNDKLNAGSGDDQIYSRDGESDDIDCGSGDDDVEADRFDSFRDCDPDQIVIVG